MAREISPYEAVERSSGADAPHRHRQGCRSTHLSRRSRRHRRADVPRQCVDVHARTLWRSRRARAHGWRRAARRAQRRFIGAAGCRAATRQARSRHNARVGDRCAVRPARSARFFHRRRYPRVPGDRLGGALQLQSHRRASHRPQTAMGAQGWRRSGPAPLQHSRQRLCHRCGRFHRRHAGDPRPRRPIAGRLRLSRRHRGRRAVENRPAPPRRQDPFQTSHAGRGAVARAQAERADRRTNAGGRGDSLECPLAGS